MWRLRRERKALSQGQRVLVSDTSGLGVVADVPVALVGGLWGDGEGGGDLLPGGARMSGTSDELVLAAGDRSRLLGSTGERVECGVESGGHRLINLR